MINVNSLINNCMKFSNLYKNIMENYTPLNMEDIETKFGIKYNGLQEGYKNIPSMHLFTDLKTGSTFAVDMNSKEEDIYKKLKNFREAF